MALTMEEWDEIQRRTIDPYRVNESNAVNRLTRVLTFGQDCILENYNKNCELIDYKTVRVKSCHYVKDDVLIYFNQDLDLDFTDESDYWSRHNNQFDSEGVYYVVLHYIYSESLPHPVAKLQIVKDQLELTEHVLKLCNVMVVYNGATSRYEIESINFEEVNYLRTHRLYNDLYTINWETLINLAISDNDTINDYVKFNGGKILDKENRVYRNIDESQLGPFPPVSSSAVKRFDLVSIDFNGLVKRHSGAEVGLNTDYTTILTSLVLPINEYPIALVLVDETSDVKIDRYDIYDIRDFLNTPYWMKSKIDDIYYLISILGTIRGGYNATQALPTSSEPGDIREGDYWYVTNSGSSGGLGGLEPGDMIVSKTTDPTSPSDWYAIQANIIDGVFPQTTSSETNNIPIYASTTGKLLKDSGVSIDEYGVMHLPPGGGISTQGSFDMSLGDLDNVIISGLLVGHGIVWNGSNFVNTTLVTSLNGRTGDVVLSKTDVDLGNVVNVASPPTTRTITAGNGLTGGGDLSANRTFTLGTPTTLTISTSNTLYSGSHTHYVAFPVTSVNSKTNAVTITASDIGATTTVHTHNNITITAGNGLTGGGDLSTNRTVTLGFPHTVTSTSINGAYSDGSHSHNITFPVTSVNGKTGTPTITYSDVGAAASTHTHTNINISAGNGLTGGGTLNVSRTLTLGTPGTLSTSTGNNTYLGGGHTHAVTFPVTSVNGETGDVTVGVDLNDSIGGDLSGTFANATVQKIQNVPLAATTPNEDDVLMYTAGTYAFTNIARDNMFGTPSENQVIVFTGSDWLVADWGTYTYDPSTSYPESTIVATNYYDRNLGIGVAVNTNLMVATRGSQVLTYIYDGVTWNLVNTMSIGMTASCVALDKYSSSLMAVGSASSRKVKIYVWLDGEWIFRDEIYESSKTNFGLSAALNGDGTILAIGSINENMVYIYTYNGTSWSLRDTINGSTGEAGKSVALTPDGNRIVIGRSKATNVFTEDGDAQIYDYNGSTWTLVTTLMNFENNYAYLGRSVAISDDGELVYVGQIGYEGIYPDQGRVVIFGWNGSTWSMAGSIDAPDPASGDLFGYAISITKNTDALFVSSPLFDGFFTNEGKIEIIR
jgi:hypothetical protein